MIIEIPRMTKEEYNTFKSQYYVKDGVPDIELELREYQEEILLKGNYEVLPLFIERLTVYIRSILLKQIKGSDFVDPAEVDALSEKAASSFIKRYFRQDNPCVGVSFAGILIFKAKEVLSLYRKNRGMETKVSLDYNSYSNNEEEGPSVENQLTYKNYLKDKDDDLSDVYLAENIWNRILKECNYIKKININYENLFLTYLTYITLLSKNRGKLKTEELSNIAIKFLNIPENDIFQLTSILESSYMDVRF